MSKPDYYVALGVSKEATQDEIKKAYRALAMQHHPDKGGDENTFKLIAEAYDVLSNPDKKAKYDNQGSMEGFDEFTSSFNDFFRNNFGVRQFRNKVRKGPPLSLIVKLTLEEIYTGTTKRFKYFRNSACETCNGKGGLKTENCVRCQGSGQIEQVFSTSQGFIRTAMNCDLCDGTGVSITDVCTVCEGAGLIRVEELIELEIPHGVVDGMRYVQQGKGNAIKDATAGDLIITFSEIPHKIYMRSGNDLRVNLKLKYAQLVLGDKIELETIDGGKIRVELPPFSNIGDNLRMRNKGMKIYQNTDRGDMILVLDIDMPKEISEEETELTKKLLELQK